MANPGALSTAALINMINTTLGPTGEGQITAELLNAYLIAAAESFPNEVDNESGLITPNWADAPMGMVLAGVLRNANMNSTADQAIPIITPAPSGKYRVSDIIVCNATVSLTMAAGGIYSAAGKTGVQIVPSTQAYSGLTGAAINVLGSSLSLSATNFATAMFNFQQMFLSLTTPQGSSAFADVYVFTRPLT